MQMKRHSCSQADLKILQLQIEIYSSRSYKVWICDKVSANVIKAYSTLYSIESAQKDV